MKRILYCFLAAALVFGLAACKDKTPDQTGDQGGEVDQQGNTFVTTDCVTPIRYADNKYIATETGVSIEVTSNTGTNFAFTCTPGEDINSYLVQVYPMAALYNSLVNQMNADGAESYTVDDTEDWITTAIRITESVSSGGRLMNAETLGEDFAEYEFDYMNNSDIQIFTVHPDCDYLIVTQACFDEEGTDYADVSICHVKTNSMDVQGNPQIGINYTAGFTAYSIEFIPNDDCGYFYFLSAPADEIQEYIDYYGEKMYHDLVINFTTSPIPADDTDYLAYTITDQNPELAHRVTAVALDVNGIPVPTVTAQEFDLVEIPSETIPGGCQISEFTAITSFAARFTMRMDANCRYAFYREYPLAEAQAIMNSDEATRQAEAESIADEGWGTSNRYYAFDPETNTATGSGDVDTYCYVSNVGDGMGGNNIDPDTEYAILYVGRNYYRQLGELQMSEPFRTKALVRDNPDACEADGMLVIPSTNRTGVTLDFSYDPLKTSVIYYQYYYPGGSEIGLPEEVREEDRDTWIYYFIDYHNPDPYSSRWCNQLDCIVNPTWDAFGWFGFEADTEYRFAYLCEDYNGVLGHVGSVTARTAAITGGDNPELEITYSANEDGTLNFVFTGNDDVRQIRYVIASNGNGAYNNFYVADVLNRDASYSEAKAFWEETIISDIAATSSNITAFNNNYVPTGWPVIAIAMAVGGADAGTPVYGDLETLFVYEDGTTMTLEEFYGITTTSVTYSYGSYEPKVVTTGGSRRISAKDAI